MSMSSQTTEKCVKWAERVPWTDEQHPDETGWTRSSTIRPTTRLYNPGYEDSVYYSPDGLRFTSIKRARGYMDGRGVKRMLTVAGGGTHTRWKYRCDEVN